MIDQKNLSDLLFSTKGLKKEFYVNPGVTISQNDVVHGRGMIATKDIKAGECIFITPPTVYADQKEVLKNFKNKADSMGLESLAFNLLVDNMMEAIEKRDHAIINSFLVLMGSSNSNFDKSGVSLKRLNGNDDVIAWSDEVLKAITKEDLRSIILKNGEYHGEFKVLRHMGIAAFPYLSQQDLANQ